MMTRISISSLVFAFLLSTACAFAQTGSVQHAATPALGNSLLVESNPQHVLSAFGCTAIAAAGAGFCVAYNAAAVPAAGALTGADVLDVCQFVSGSSGCSFSRLPQGAMYSAGIVILLTSATTPFTYTTGVLNGFIWADFN